VEVLDEAPDEPTRLSRLSVDRLELLLVDVPSIESDVKVRLHLRRRSLRDSQEASELVVRTGIEALRYVRHR
jgi:hypothetical protein